MEHNEQQEMNIFTMFSRIGKSIGRTFLGLFSFFGFLFRVIYQYKYLFLIFAAVTTAWVIYDHREEARIYRGNMYLHINDGNAMIFEELVKNLNDFPKNDDYEGLSKALDIPIETAVKIASIRTHGVIDINNDTIIDMVDYKDDVNLGDTVNVRVADEIVVSLDMKSIELFPEMQKSILKYFSDNNYLVSLNLARLASLEEKEWMFHNALLNLDSLQKVEYFHQNLGASIFEFSSPTENKKPFVTSKKQMFYNNMVDLFKLTDEIAVDMSTNLEVVTVISDFKPIKYPVNSLAKIILKRGLLMFVLFLIFALFWNYRSKISDYLNKEL